MLDSQSPSFAPQGRVRLRGDLMNAQRFSRLLPALALVAASCETPPVQYEPVAITSFTSSATTVAAGSPVTLRWVVAGPVAAVDVTRDGAVITESPKAEGEVVAEALAAGTTTFVVSARGRAGDVVEQRLEVRAVTAASVDAFTVDRGMLPAGGSVTLTWRTVLADRITISEGATQIAERTGADAAAGSLLVRPNGSTEYLLVAEGVGGRAEARVSVSMVDAPNVVSFTAEPTRVAPGETTTVRWSIEGAEAVTLRVDGRVVYEVPSSELRAGSRTLTINRQTRVELAAARAGLVSTKAVTIDVSSGPRIVAFDAQPGFLAAGSTTTLSWEVADADTVSLLADDEAIELEDPAATTGTLALTPGETRTYTLVATSAAGEARESLLVEVHGTALIETFEADRTELFRGREPATLSWATLGGSELSITDAEGNVVDVRGQSITNGSVEVRPETSTSFVLALVGPAGIVTSDPIVISVSEPPPVVHLALSKPTMLDGENAELSWKVADHESFEITANGVAIDLGGRGAEDSLVVRPEATTEYVLTATGRGGTESATVTLTVVKPPSFTVFTSNRLNGDRVTVTKGERHTVTWATTDATAVEFVPPRADSGNELFTSIKGLPGTVTLTKEGTNDSGFANATFPDGFTFPYGNGRYTTAQVAMDGYVCFGGTDECNTTSTFTNQAVPSATKPNNLIAAFWDDLEWVDAQTAFLMNLDTSSTPRRLTIEWNEVDFFTSTDDGAKLTFQVVLFEDGYWEIRNAARPTPTVNIASNRRWGSSATIGAESAGGASGTLFSFDTDGSLCSSYTPGSGTTFGRCTMVSRISPLRLPTSGSTELQALSDDILAMRAVGPLGVATSPSLVVKTFVAAEARELSASRTLIGTNESVILTWSAGPNTTVVKGLSISDGTTQLAGVSGLAGNVTVRPQATTTYTLTVANELGDTATKSVTVEVGVPTATLALKTASLPVGEQYEVSWTSAGANTVRLVDPQGYDVIAPLDSANEADRIRMASGSQKFTAPASGTYSLLATNGSGTTTASVELEVVTEPRIIAFTTSCRASDEKAVVTPCVQQTEARTVTLAWETYNAQRITITSTAPGSTATEITASALTRSSAIDLPVGPDDTTYTLTLHAADGSTLTHDVVVESVDGVQLELTAQPSSIGWNTATSLRWTTTNATKVRIVERVGTGATATDGAEVAAARDLPSGSAPVTLTKTTTFRLYTENVLGTPKSTDVTVTVVVQDPTVALTVTPSTGLPRGGFARLSWTATTAESVFLWKKALAADTLQVPYDYVPYGFEDIRSSGTELVLAAGGVVGGTENYDTGSAIVTFPADFAPMFFGVEMRGMAVSADGLAVLSPTPNDLTSFQGCVSTTCTTNATTLTTSTPNGYMAPFWDDLRGCNGQTTRAACPETRAGGSGRVYFQLRGTAPNRVAIVQWHNFDFTASGTTSSLTFQAKLHENGDVEYQYKTLQGNNTGMATGNSATVAAEARQSADGLILRSNTAGVVAGDGYRIFSGRRPASGSVRTFFNPATSATAVNFRATALNSKSEIGDAKSVPLRHGIGDLVISELMIDPDSTDDTGKEWIEIRNTRTEAANLRGYTIQTSSGSYTFNADLTVPARASNVDGHIVLGQSTDQLVNGGVPVALAYGNAMQLDDLAETVVLRFGDVLVDRVEYDRDSGWSIPTNRALALDAGSTMNDFPELWCPSRNVNDASARATPGALNGRCYSFVRGEYDPSTSIATNPAATRVYKEGGDSYQNGVPIGFSFPYFGFNQTEFAISTDGFLAFSTLASSSFSNLDLPNAGVPVDGLYILWDDLSGITGLTPISSGVYTLVTGTAPNRKLIVNWYQYRFLASACGTAPLDFSIVLSEQGGIEYHYAPATSICADGRSATVGLEALGDGASAKFTYGTSTTVAGPGLAGTSLRLVRSP